MVIQLGILVDVLTDTLAKLDEVGSTAFVQVHVLEGEKGELLAALNEKSEVLVEMRTRVHQMRSRLSELESELVQVRNHAQVCTLPYHMRVSC